MDFVVSNPAWFAIILFGVVSIISGIMLTGRDLDPIERVLPAISGIQRWCGIGILLAAVFVFLASPLTAKHLWLAEQKATNAMSAAATDALADALNASIVTAINDSLGGLSSDPGFQAQMASALQTSIATCQSSGLLSITGTSAAQIQANAGAAAGVIATQLAAALPSGLSAAQQADLTAGVTAGIREVFNTYASTASPGALTHKDTVTFYNPLSNIWATMLGVFGILVLVFSQVTEKYGDQKPLSTMLIALWPVVVAMTVFTWKLRSGGSGDIPGVMTDTFIMLVLASITIPLCILGMREKPREAGEWSGYGFILLGICSLYIGIKYLWLFEVQPFLHISA